MRIPSGSTDRYVYFVAVDSTDFTTRETGLTTFTVYRSRNGGAAAAMTTPTINETDTTNMPGVYELLLDEDTTLTAGNDTEEIVFHITQASMAPVTRVVEIYRPETTEGNTLDVTATGAGGIDWGNVENPTTAVDLSATDIQLCDTITTYTGNTVQTGDSYARLGAPAGASVSADIATVDTVADGIKAKTDSLTFTVANQVDSNAIAISGDTTSADNLELMYDGTGYTDATAPASRAQVDAIGAASGGSVNIEATEDNTGGAIDPSSAAFVGSVQSGTFASTEAEDGTLHDIDDTTNDIDIVYGFDVGGSRTATEVNFAGFCQGSSDEIKIKAYDHVGADWEIIGTLPGQNGTTNVTLDLALLLKHTGTGAEVGKVYIRFETDSTTPSNLSVDKLLISAVTSSLSIGYADGAIWYDDTASNTNTESYVDGVADNPVSTWAAVKTLITNVGVKRVRIAAGSGVTLDAASDNYVLVGPKASWTLALGGQSIDGMTVDGAIVTGTGEATTTQPVFQNCSFGAATVPPCIAQNCGFGNASGTFTAAVDAGEYLFEDCFSEVPGSGSPVFNFAPVTGASGINNRRWSGGATYTLDSNCTLSHEVLAGGGTTITTGGGDVEVRGTCRDLTVTMSAAETVQFVGTTGPITLSGTTTGTVNLYGVSASLTDTTSAATVTDKTVSHGDVDAILTDTNELQGDWADGGRLDLILDATATQASVDTIDGIVDSILVDTAEIGAAGAGLTEAGGTGDQYTAIPWNASWDAEVESEVNDALVALGLDHLVSAAVTGTDVTDNSIIAYMVSKSATADWDSFVNTTDALEAIADASAPTAAAIADAVWDEAQADHTTVGTFGVTASEIADILTDTGTTIPATLSTMESKIDVVDGIVDSILVDTAEIGAAGAGLTEAGGTGDHLTAIAWNAAWDAEVQSEANDALVALGLDHLVSAAVTGTDVTDNSIIAKLVSKSATADWDSFVNTTDALEAIADASTPPTAAAIADAVWDEAQADHVAAGSMGLIASEVADILTDTSTTIPAQITTAQNDLDTITGADGVTLATTQANYAPATAAALAAAQTDLDTITDTGVTCVALTSAAITDVWSTDTLTESYAADGAAGTPAQIIYLVQQRLNESSASGTTLTTKKLDGSTTAATFTLNSATDPTSITRAT